MSVNIVRRIGRRIAREFVGPALPPLDPEFANRERVFRAPALTQELASAIRLISPHCDFPAGKEKYRRAWEIDQNAACWAEFDVLEPSLRTLPRGARILEIGPGMGRTLVFFSKKLDGCELHAYEGEGNRTKYTKLGPRFEDSFCGNISCLEQVLEYNGVGQINIHRANDMRLAELPGPFDLIYSFYAIGYHWDLRHFLPDIIPLMAPGGIAAFIVPTTFEPFDELRAMSFEVLPLKLGLGRVENMVILHGRNGRPPTASG